MGDNAVGWRVGSAIAGSLTLAAIMLLTYALLHSVEYMVIAGLLTIFDNFLFVMSRIAMLDAFLMLFLFWGYLFFLAGMATEYDRRTRSICLVLSGTFFGLATACKWNGLFSIAALTCIGFIVYLRQRNFSLPLFLVSFSVVPSIGLQRYLPSVVSRAGTVFHSVEPDRRATRNVLLHESDPREPLSQCAMVSLALSHPAHARTEFPRGQLRRHVRRRTSAGSLHLAPIAPLRRT